MTCIVSYIDKEDKKVWMASDTCISTSGGVKRVLSNPKIFKIKDADQKHEYLIGVSGDPKCQSLLQYSLEIPNRNETDINKFMHTEFVNSVIECLKVGLYSRNVNNVEEMDSHILVATDTGGIFCIEGNYQVIKSVDKYYASGSGTKIALGSLFTTKNLDLSAQDKTILAIESAAEYETTVALPMDIESINII